MSGPPGSGKTLLARSMPSILPRMTPSEALDVTRIYSVAGMLPGDVPLIRHRPFRAPHHTISNAGLVGGGQWPRPGEISLAHRGVLFLDEMPEFGQHGLEVLRQPLEDKVVTISRAQGSLTFPANFMLVGAQNPCPCGYFGDPEHACTCSPMLISRYQKRLSGPLLDRIDIHVEVPRVPFQKLSDERRGEPSAAIRARVEAARARQSARFANAKDGQGASLTTNADMGPTQVRDHCPVDETGRHTEGARRGNAPDEPERAGVSSGAQAGADDCGSGGERAHPAGAYRGGDPVSAAAAGVRLAKTLSHEIVVSVRHGANMDYLDILNLLTNVHLDDNITATLSIAWLHHLLLVPSPSPATVASRVFRSAQTRRSDVPPHFAVPSRQSKRHPAVFHS